MRKLDIGAAISGAFDLYAKNWQLLITLSLLVYAVVGVLVAIFLGVLFTSVTAAAVLSIVLLVLGLLASYLVQGMTILAVADMERGASDISIGSLLGRAQSRLGALIGTSLLAALGIMVGMVLLVVPGIYLMVMWAFVAVIVMLEGISGGTALSRSKEIVSGNGWMMLLLLIIVAVIGGVANGVIGGIVRGISPSLVLDQFLGFVVPGAIVGPFGALVSVLAYRQLTGGVDGGSAAQPAPATTADAAAAPVQPSAPGQSETPPPPASPLS